LSKAGARVDKVGVRGFSSVMGCQKGAAAVTLQFKGVSFLFITSHFSGESYGSAESLMFHSAVANTWHGNCCMDS